MLQGPDKMVGMESERAWTEEVPAYKDQLMLWIGKRDGVGI